MKVLIVAIITIGCIAIVSLWAPSGNAEIVKLGIASIGSLATGIELGKAMAEKPKEPNGP